MLRPIRQVSPLVFTATLILGSLGACSKPAPPAADKAADSAKPSNESAAKAVFDQWLASQNEGDFSRYTKLYATKFEGVKRSGEKVRRFNRAGWLTDREKMFQKKMLVEASDVKIQTGPTYALVTFTQTWSSGTYKDRGPKRLMLVQEEGRLMLAKEEMLASTMMNAEPPRIVPPDQLTPVVMANNKPYIVLSAEPDAAWGAGEPRVLSRDSFTLIQGTEPSAVPAELKGQVGRPFALYSPSGVVCQATVKSLGILGRVIPHFGMREIWTQDLEGKAQTEAQAAPEVWSWTESGRLLVGELETKGTCTEALWARGGALAPLAPIPLDDAGEPFTTQALQELRKLPIHKKLQKEFETWSQESGSPSTAPWDTFEGAKPVVKLIGKPGGDQKALISLTLQAGYGCGSFEGSLWVLWEVTGSLESLKWTLANDPANALAVTPKGVMDVDGDGSLELLFTGEGLDQSTGFIRLNGARYLQQQIIRVPYLDCPC